MTKVNHSPASVALLAVLLSLGNAGTLWAQDGDPKRLLLVGQSPDGHPQATHEYMPGLRLLGHCLSEVPDLAVEVVEANDEWLEGPDQIRTADGVVLFLAQGARWVQAEPRRLEALAQLAERGGGIMALHWAIGTRSAEHIEGYLELLGGCHGGPDRRYKFLETSLGPAVDEHPILSGIEAITIRDEFYFQLKFIEPAAGLTPLMQAEIEGNQETVAWAWERPDGGRSFGFSGLHFHENWSELTYRRLCAQAALWTLEMPVPEEGMACEIAAEHLELPARPQE